jgi:phage terminase large subunit
VFVRTTAYNKIAALKKDVRIIQGGTSASKTISILLYLIDYAQSVHEKTISVVSESLPHMKKGALKDFLSIMKKHGYYREESYNRSDHIYTFETGTIMEFFGLDDPDKAHGPRRDVLFINEANNIAYATYDALDVRTAEFTIIDYNPSVEFWVHTEVIPKMDHDFLIVTYKDNEALSEKVVRKIEARRHNDNWWRVYGLGLIGKLEGLIFPNYEIIPKVPEDARLARHIVDFGYTNDDAAIADLYAWNGGFVIDELGYGTGIKNREIANFIRASEGLLAVESDRKFDEITQILTVADSAEPKSVDDLKDCGVKAIGSTKGGGSVNAGIEQVQDQKLYITAQSTNYIKCFRNYQWKIDRKTNKSTNVPEHEFSHAPDSVRYGITDILGVNVVGVDDIIM